MNDAELLSQIVVRCGANAVVMPGDAAGRPINVTGDVLHAVPVLRPASTQDVAAMVRLTREAGLSLVPLGGGSGLVGGTLPVTGKEWYLSMERMREIEEIDPVSRLAVVQAGVVLQTLQESVAEKDLLFPVDLGARGSANVGGLISTNAGGERVLRFGMMREQVLGLEVVLADGNVLDLMDRVVKNNAGYDLKQIFIGAEGTLGIVTRAVLRLRPAFSGHSTALLAVSRFDDVSGVLRRLEGGLGGTLSAFELMLPDFMNLMTEGSPPRHQLPVTKDAAAYLLVEAEGGDPERDQERFMSLLEGMLEDGTLADAAIPQSKRESQALWAIRNDIHYIVDSLSPLVSFDVSVPIACMQDYIQDVSAGLRQRWPGVRLLIFGHVADNNLHIVASVGPDTRDRQKEIAEIVYRDIGERRGSISAEHGIGVQKRDSLVAHRPPEVVAFMKVLKQTLDPLNQFNPGKVI